MAKARKKQPFDVKVFLNTVGGGRTVSNYRKARRSSPRETRGMPSSTSRKGKVKVCVVSEQGKEAVVALHGNGDFFGRAA